MIEVGVVYQGSSSRGTRFLLALPGGKILEFVQTPDGPRPKVSSPRCRLSPARGYAVEDVCAAWGVTVAAVDAVLREAFSPEAAGIDAVRLRSSRGDRDLEDWRSRRTFRVAPQARGILGGRI